MTDKLREVFILKNGEEIEIETGAYFGFIFAEGFVLSDSLKVKSDKIVYKRGTDNYEFTDIDDFIKFLVDDIDYEEVYDYEDNIYYKQLKNKIKKISDISKIHMYFTYVDEDEKGFEFFNYKEDIIDFKKFEER
jgi:hypothetical protein